MSDASRSPACERCGKPIPIGDEVLNPRPSDPIIQGLVHSACARAATLGTPPGRPPRLPAEGPIAAAWNEYRNKVVPVGAGAVQLQERRRDFYAGAWAALNLLIDHPVALHELEQECKAQAAVGGQS